ncbi:iron ABC transporter ATP-binding protein [Aureimonas altamirensis]|uniref:Iron ABC transporter ATP-binding protein n=1 Tax=Aureimonas altamirensis TaxID=370622 RepID=A0A0B1PY42_9HYPH|nr:ABC transporter ATP-binding protein [Aureimonas altamirensis]KHJ53024.1 iron ABC transporter ATP-binding protein [Aureimonas altamirensis]
MIETGQLTKAYGDVLVVDGVSLRIPAGGVTAIIGPNGAGKSTFLSMVARLTPMSSGVVTVGGLDVSGTPGDVLAKRLSILRQDNQIAMRLTVRDLVSFGRYPHSKGRLTSADAAKVDEAIGFLNLGDLSERFLDELSGGQRQRAFVAMVLAQDTDYVLLDEPLNNLDMKHAVAMMQLVRNAADKLGKTVVVVLHDINFASCYADHIVAMRDGRLAMQGPPSQLITTEALARIYDMEIPVEIIGGRRICVYFG